MSSGQTVRRSTTSTSAAARSTASSATATPEPYVTIVASEPGRTTAALQSGVLWPGDGRGPRARR